LIEGIEELLRCTLRVEIASQCKDSKIDTPIYNFIVNYFP
jgi:hypothetical protein